MERGAWRDTGPQSHGQRNLAGYSPGGRKGSGTTEVTQHAPTEASEALRF